MAYGMLLLLIIVNLLVTAPEISPNHPCVNPVNEGGKLTHSGLYGKQSPINHLVIVIQLKPFKFRVQR